MGMLLLRFSFVGEPPALTELFDQIQWTNELPVRFKPRGKDSAVLTAPGVEGVGLVRTQGAIEIHCALAGSGMMKALKAALRRTGGSHPPRQVDRQNPDYGEGWLGILAEGDDYIVTAGDCTFRIWCPFVNPLCESVSDPSLNALEDSLWDGNVEAVQLDALLAAIDNASPQFYCDVLSPDETKEALLALRWFLVAARHRGVRRISIRSE